MIDMPIPASPQKSSSFTIGSVMPAGIGPELRERLVAVQADFGRLLDHRPRGLLALVPLVSGGADDLLGEAVHPVTHVALVLAQLQGERDAFGGLRL